MLTHGNIFANVVQTEAWTNPAYVLSGDERYLVVIPYFHIYAFTVCMMIGLRIGALQIIHPKYDPEQVLASIREFRPTYFPAVPTVFVSLLNHPRVGEFGLEHVRMFNSGGAPCPVEVHGGVRAPHRPAAERRLRALGDLAGHAFDAAARAPQARARSACRFPTPT